MSLSDSSPWESLVPEQGTALDTRRGSFALA